METPPLCEGRQQLTANWALLLPFPMARRFEQESLVFWYSPRKLTFWLSVYGAQPGREPGATVEWIKQLASPDRYDAIEETDGGALRYAYRLAEHGDGRLPSFYGHTIAPTGEYILLAGYFDFPELFDDVLATWRSIGWAGDIAG